MFLPLSLYLPTLRWAFAVPLLIMWVCSRVTEFLAYIPHSSAYASNILSQSALLRIVLSFLSQSSPGKSLGVVLCFSAAFSALSSRDDENFVLEQWIGNDSISLLVQRCTLPDTAWTRRVSTPKYCSNLGHSAITLSSIPNSILLFTAWLSGVLFRSGRYISFVGVTIVFLQCHCPHHPGVVGYSPLFLCCGWWYCCPLICHLCTFLSWSVLANFLWVVSKISQICFSLASCT